MNEELLAFTKQALALKIARPAIVAALSTAGWDKAEIASALGAYAEVDFALPVPRPKPYLSARDVFVYLVMFGALYDSCWHVGSLIFDLINRAFPDPAMRNSYWATFSADSMRWSVAQLLVSFPVFFFTFNRINHAIAVNPAHRHSKVRKWLTYLTLLIATLSLTCDVGTLIYDLLAGELTARFLLKALTVAVIAGGAFAYFISDMRQEEKA